MNASASNRKNWIEEWKKTCRMQRRVFVIVELPPPVAPCRPLTSGNPRKPAQPDKEGTDWEITDQTSVLELHSMFTHLIICKGVPRSFLEVAWLGFFSLLRLFPWWSMACTTLLCFCRWSLIKSHSVASRNDCDASNLLWPKIKLQSIIYAERRQCRWARSVFGEAYRECRSES